MDIRYDVDIRYKYYAMANNVSCGDAAGETHGMPKNSGAM